MKKEMFELNQKKTKKVVAWFLTLVISLVAVPMDVFASRGVKTENMHEEKDVDEYWDSDEKQELDSETVPKAVGYEEARKKGHTQRMYNEEGTNLNTVVFMNDDGSRTEYLFDYPVKYVDDEGKIEDVSLNIVDSNEENVRFETEAGNAITKFPNELSDGIELKGNHTEISLIPHADSEAQRIDEKTISYDYDEKTTLEYSLTYTGFKEDIVVNEFTGQTEYEFTMYTNGLKPKEIEGSYYLVDENEEIKATIGDIIIFTADEKNNTMGKLVSETIVERQEYLMTIIVDKDFLEDAKTKYPICILVNDVRPKI